MTESALLGRLGYGIQASKGTAKAPAASGTPIPVYYTPAVSVDLSPDQNAFPVPPEVAGNHIYQEILKGVVNVGGGITLNARAKGIVPLLYGLLGVIDSQARGGGSTAYDHAITYDPETDIPWLTTYRQIGTQFTERYTDCRVASMRLAMRVGAPAQVQFGVAGITPDIVSNAADDVLAYGKDSGPVLVTTKGTCEATIEAISPTPFPMAATDIQIDLGNALTQDEYVCGSYFLDNITRLQVVGSLQYTSRIQSPELYKLIYYNGGTSFSPIMAEGSFSVECQSVADVSDAAADSGIPFALTVALRRVRLMMAPISLQGNSLIDMAVVGMMMDTQDGDSPLIITATNQEVSYV